MRILLISSSYNSLTQRAHVELTDAGHEVSIELAISPEHMISAVELFKPDLIIAPMLTKAIPKHIWSRYICLIVHPGIMGDRGPSALDWAIMERPAEWGVTLLQAVEEMDAGDIWATHTFPMRDGSKGSIYRREVSNAAMACIHEALEKFQDPTFKPRPLDYSQPDVLGRERPLTTQLDRYLDWSADTETVLRRIWSADGSPGVLEIFGQDAVYLYGAHRESQLRGEPGQILGQRDGAICIATGDGAVWITHAKQRVNGRKGIKLPAATVLMEHLVDVPYLPVTDNGNPDHQTWQEIRYHEADEVGYLHFDFYNGAMGTEQCHRLRRAYTYARSRPTKVIVLCGGEDFWSNGIHLNEIEAARIPAEEAWANIQAINDLVLEILSTDSHWVISSLGTNAGAGGVTLAMAADEVICREGVVLNPHYRTMGELYGSEYWTYLWPRRVGTEKAQALWRDAMPVSGAQALDMGMIDQVGPAALGEFNTAIREHASTLAKTSDLRQRLASKARQLHQDQMTKPLSEYRREELQQMWQNFFGADRQFHKARYDFVYKAKAQETPIRLATHRSPNYESSQTSSNVVSLAQAKA